MALFHSPRITTNGLILCLDSGNVKSYTGSGTSWTDTVSTSSCTLQSSPTYIPGLTGYFSFNGTSNYAEITTRRTDLEFQPTQPYSLCCWLYNLTFGAGQAIISNMQSSATFSGWDIWGNASNQIAAHFISSWNTNAIKVKIDVDYSSFANRWTNIVVTYNGTCPTNATDSLNSINFYINGSLYTNGKANDSSADGFDTSSSTISYNTSQRFRIGSRWASGTVSQGMAVSISNIMIYSKALTATEVAQNYNALRGRFGV